MSRRKKKGHLVVLFSFLGILLLICVYLTFITVPALKKTQFGQMINFCHNRGSIEFFVDGKKMVYEDIKVTREIDGQSDQAELTEDCEFTFFSGKEGLDTYKFFVDKEAGERLKDIEVTFKNFNEDWWIVNNFDIKIDVTKSEKGIFVTGTCFLNGEKIVINEKVQEQKNLYAFEVDLNS